MAGGLNLYGFANGDPVNFSDPFGLTADTVPEELQEKIGYELCTLADCDNVDIKTGGVIGWLTRRTGSAVALGNTIYFPRELSADRPADVAWLAHELMHVVQYRMDGSLSYYMSALEDRIKDIFGDPYNWRRPALAGKRWEWWGMEAQAEVMRDCFLGVALACSHSYVAPPEPGR